MAAHREQYDAAVSRAVANAATLEELTLPFVQKGGVAIAWKGPGVAEEMTAARRAAFLLGGTVRGTVDAPIPGRDDWAHVLLLTDKTGRPRKPIRAKPERRTENRWASEYGREMNADAAESTASARMRLPAQRTNGNG